MSSVNDIRSAFLSFFEKNDHKIVSSSPLVPRNDPTLMFTNAGMVQFKNVFTGLEKRDYQRAVTSQKCVRAGGKHNDLDNVGYTARHHTFFEMLGNFSFGDYFKERAIELAWTLITKEFALPKDRLLVTVYSEDDDAYSLWKKIAGFSDDRIIRIPTSDNFWAMGDTGPCGPCSEIFYDHGAHIPGGPPGSADQDGDRFIEIWNLVFMQFEQRAPGDRVALPRPSIDTGMGLERVSAVLQGTHDNYETDMMRALVEASAHLTSSDPRGVQAASHRVIADHLRSSAFLVADGVLPSNEGRGYVLRRIMRRAMRHAQILGARDPLMHRLVPVLVREMGHAYPELVRCEPLIAETLLLEETRFRKTLERGLSILEEETASLSSGSQLSGDVAFKLYDTYGFPVDLTADALRARSIGVDMEGFQKSMERQKAEARQSWSGSGEATTLHVWFELKEKLPPCEFLGYDSLEAEAEISALLFDGQPVQELKTGQSGFFITNQTPFYAQSGGQIGDAGQITWPQGLGLVSDTHKELGALFVHHVTVEQGTLRLGDVVSLRVDASRRRAISANHSATHLLHEALRQVLGDHVAQKGSLVGAERLRFDFSHTKPVASSEMERVEAIANDVLLQNSSVETRLMSVDDAIASGARALFGEKYGDEVRVVSMGGRFSVELCGGTHVQRTGEIGSVCVVAESGVASGVRRIEALTGEAARRHLSEQAQVARSLADRLKISLDDLPARFDELLESHRRLEKQLSEARRQLAFSSDTTDSPSVRQVGDVQLFSKILSGIPASELKSFADEGKKQVGSGVVVIVGVDEAGKAGVVVGVTPDLTHRFDAVSLVRAASETLGGRGGGGRPDLAQAGGPNGQAANDAVETVCQLLAS